MFKKKEEEVVIGKIWYAACSNQSFVTVPRKTKSLKAGDYVRLVKIE